MMKRILVLFIFLTFVSCNRELRDKLSFPNINSSTEIVIEQQKKIKNESSYTFGPTGTIYKAKSTKHLKMFENLISNAEHTDYCCCPEENYTISFYYHQNNFETFLVDTTEFKNKVRIFESGYQYSYIIDKKMWKDFLKEIN